MNKRKILYFIIIFSSSALLKAQNVIPGQDTTYRIIRKNFVSMRASYPIGLSASFTQINKDWGWSVNGSFAVKSAQKLPIDYEPGSFGSNIILDQISYLSGHYVWEFPKHLKHLHFGLEAGPAYFYVNSAENFLSKPRACDGLLLYLCSSNYSYDRKDHHLLGVSSRAKIRIDAPKVFLGLELSLVGLYNPVRSYIGMELAMIIGDLD